MNVWTITAMGIFMVFGILLILSQILLWVGRLVGPRPEEVGPKPPQPSTDGEDVRRRDTAVITSILSSMGYKGRIRVRRTNK